MAREDPPAIDRSGSIEEAGRAKTKTGLDVSHASPLKSSIPFAPQAARPHGPFFRLPTRIFT